MKIILDELEAVHLQNICREPSKYQMEEGTKEYPYYKVLMDAGLIKKAFWTEPYLYPTEFGKEVLKAHLPIVNNGRREELNKTIFYNSRGRYY